MSAPPGEGRACWDGDCQPMADMCGLPLALFVPDWLWFAVVGGSRICGGPYWLLGCEVMGGREPPTLGAYDWGVSAGEERGLGCGISLRM